MMKTTRQTTTSTSFRLCAEIQQMLQRATEHERCPQPSMLEIMVESWCKEHRILAPKRGAR
jgi:hypothetical protein